MCIVRMIIRIREFSLNLLPALFSLILLLPATSSAKGEIVPDQIEGATKISAEKLSDLAETLSDLIIVDARISNDRIYGFIEGSISLPNTKTDCNSLSKVVKSFKTPTIYYCNGPKCGRSLKSVKIALSCGYSKLYWYRGGFEDWKEKGYSFIMSDK